MAGAGGVDHGEDIPPQLAAEDAEILIHGNNLLPIT